MHAIPGCSATPFPATSSTKIAKVFTSNSAARPRALTFRTSALTRYMEELDVIAHLNDGQVPAPPDNAPRMLIDIAESVGSMGLKAIDVFVEFASGRQG